LVRNSKEHKPEVTPSHEHKDALVVNIRTNIFSIRNIDIVEQNFTVDIFLEASIQSPKYEHLSEEELTPVLKREINFNFSNLLEQESYEEWAKKDTHGRVYFRIRFVGKFSQKYDLKMFPFDNQSLIIKVSSFRMITDLVLKDHFEGKNHLLCPGKDSFTLTDWTLWNILEVQETQSDPLESSSGTIYPALEFKMEVSRNYIFYITNVLSIMCCLVLMAGVSFAIPRDDIGDRASVVVTLILTAVAFRFSTNSSVPKVSFLTFLDRYMFSAFGFLSFILLENAVIFKISDDNKEELELIFMLLIGVFWVLYNIYSFIRVFWHMKNFKEGKVRRVHL